MNPNVYIIADNSSQHTRARAESIDSDDDRSVKKYAVNGSVLYTNVPPVPVYQQPIAYQQPPQYAP
jgi:hypothetical protein